MYYYMVEFFNVYLILQIINDTKCTFIVVKQRIIMYSWIHTDTYCYYELFDTDISLGIFTDSDTHYRLYNLVLNRRFVTNKILIKHFANTKSTIFHTNLFD